MATATVDAEIIIRTERARAELEKMPGVTKSQATKMASVLSKEWGRAEKEAEKTAKKIAADAERAARKAADEAQRATERAAEAAERAAERAAAQAERAWEQGVDGMKGATEKLASMIGGPFADVGDVVFGFGEQVGKASTVIGTAGVAAGAAAGAVVLLGTAAVAGARKVVELVDAAQQARGRLEGMSKVAPIPAASIEALDDWRDTSRAAAVATDLLTVKVGGIAARAFEPAARAVVGFADQVDDLLPSIDAVVDTISAVQTATRAMGAVVSLGGTELARLAIGMGDLAAAGDAATESLARFEATQRLLDAHVPAAEKFLKITEQAVLAETGASSARQALLEATEAVDQATAEYVTSLQTLNLSEEELRIQSEAAVRVGEKRKAQLVAELEATEERTAATKATADATKEAAEAERERAKALAGNDAALRAEEQLRDLVLATTADTVGAEEQIQRAYETRLEAIANLAAGGASYAEVAEARDQAELRRQRDLAELSQTRARAAEEEAAKARQLEEDLRELDQAVQQLGDSWVMTTSAGAAALQVWAEQVGPVVDLAIDAANRITDAFREGADRRIEAIQDEMEARRESIDAWKEGELEKVDAMVASGEISEKQAVLERRRIQQETAAKRRAMMEQTRAEREAAMDAWRRNQAVQRALAIIEAARAVGAALAGAAALGPIAAAAAVAGATATGIATIAAIDSAKPPEFPMGRLPEERSAGGGSQDHPRIVRVRDDETILDGRTTSRLGGRDGVRRLMAAGAGGGGEVVINLVVGGRLRASGVLDPAGNVVLEPTPGSWAAGRRPLHGR